jgi:hypothetical protein
MGLSFIVDALRDRRASRVHAHAKLRGGGLAIPAKLERIVFLLEFPTVRPCSMVRTHERRTLTHDGRLLVRHNQTATFGLTS